MAPSHNSTSENQQAARWDRLRELVEAETGMDFSGNRFSRLRDAVQRVLSAESTPRSLEQILADPRHQGMLLERVTAELTIGETFFFRNSHHFRALREQVFPEILQTNTDKREVRVWSAGCATGEEPYSLAILLDELLASRPEWTAHILATDLNPKFLEKARLGRFRPWSFRQTDVHKDSKYFAMNGKDYCLTPRIRQMVRFAYLNLVKDVYPSPLTGTLGLDLILFRNVAIYLQSEVTRLIIQQFHRALRPGGWLLLGETEVGIAPTEGFELHRFPAATFFRKRRARGAISDVSVPMPGPPLAAVLQRRAPSATVRPALPDWVPLPTAASVTAASVTPVTLTKSVTDQVRQFLGQRNFVDAERTIDQIPGKQDRVAARLQYVRDLLASAEIPRARGMLAKCLAEEPLQLEAQLLKASFAEEDGDLDAAEQAYRRALYVDRKFAMAHFQLALVQREKGDFAGAGRSLEIARELAQGEDVHQAVPYGDGVCYGRLQEMIDGVLDF